MRLTEEERLEAVLEALDHMCHQFAYEGTVDGIPVLSTGGLSALEGAFRVLGWEDPHPTPERKCDEPGCGKHISCGTPTLAGYRNTCGDHVPEAAYEEWRKAMFEGPIGKRMLIQQGYVPSTCTLPDEFAGPLIYSEVSAGRDVCAGCEGDREVCKGRPKK